MRGVARAVLLCTLSVNQCRCRYYDPDCYFSSGEPSSTATCDSQELLAYYNGAYSPYLAAGPFKTVVCQRQGNGNAFQHAYWQGARRVLSHLAPPFICAATAPPRALAVAT